MEPRRCFVRATSDRQKVKLLAKRQTLNTSVRGTSSSFGPGPACGPSVEIQIGKDKRRRRIRFGKNEGEDPSLVVIREEITASAILAYNRVRPVGISQVPERSATADRRQRDKVFMRRRRSGRPFERPCVPGVIARYFAAEKRSARSSKPASATAALMKKHADGRNHVHPAPAW